MPAGITPRLELPAALEVEVTDLFTDNCDTGALAGGPFAAVNDAVNCCVIGLEKLDVDVAEIISSAVEIFAEAVAETDVLAPAVD